MANSNLTILSTLKEFYKEVRNGLMPGKSGIDKFFFSTDDRSTEANFNLDKLVYTPHGISFRHPNTGSVVREYTPGTGEFFSIPHASEKTPITESMRDQIVVGATGSGFTESAARRIMQIMEEHTIAHESTRWKYAIDVMRTGKFSPLGQNGADIGGLEIDFDRDATLDITADFTDTDVTFDVAMKALYVAYRAKNGPTAGISVLMGTDWLNSMQTDDDVLTRMQANAANVLIRQNMNPPEFNSIQGLKFIGEYLVPGTLTSIQFFGYEPDDQFTAYKGATAADFFPSDEALMFSTTDKRYRVFGGIDALTDAGRAVRLTGTEVVFDTFGTPDPVAENIRSQTRYALIPANVDHTARSTGTFTSES